VEEMSARRRDLSFGRSKGFRPFFSAFKLTLLGSIKPLMATLELAAMDTSIKWLTR